MPSPPHPTPRTAMASNHPHYHTTSSLMCVCRAASVITPPKHRNMSYNVDSGITVALSSSELRHDTPSALEPLPLAPEVLSTVTGGVADASKANEQAIALCLSTLSSVAGLMPRRTSAPAPSLASIPETVLIKNVPASSSDDDERTKEQEVVSFLSRSNSLKAGFSRFALCGSNRLTSHPTHLPTQKQLFWWHDSTSEAIHVVVRYRATLAVVCERHQLQDA